MREFHEQRQHALRRPSARPAGRPARTPGLAEPAGLRRTSAGLALVLGLLVTIVMVFLTPGEAYKLYERRVQRAPVRALTGRGSCCRWPARLCGSWRPTARSTATGARRRSL